MTKSSNSELNIKSVFQMVQDLIVLIFDSMYIHIYLFYFYIEILLLKKRILIFQIMNVIFFSQFILEENYFITNNSLMLDFKRSVATFSIWSFWKIIYSFFLIGNGSLIWSLSLLSIKIIWFVLPRIRKFFISRLNIKIINHSKQKVTN